MHSREKEFLINCVAVQKRTAEIAPISRINQKAMSILPQFENRIMNGDNCWNELVQASKLTPDEHCVLANFSHYQNLAKDSCPTNELSKNRILSYEPAFSRLTAWGYDPNFWNSFVISLNLPQFQFVFLGDAIFLGKMDHIKNSIRDRILETKLWERDPDIMWSLYNNLVRSNWSHELLDLLIVAGSATLAIAFHAAKIASGKTCLLLTLGDKGRYITGDVLASEADYAALGALGNHETSLHVLQLLSCPASQTTQENILQAQKYVQLVSEIYRRPLRIGMVALPYVMRRFMTGALTHFHSKHIDRIYAIPAPGKYLVYDYFIDRPSEGAKASIGIGLVVGEHLKIQGDAFIASPHSFNE